MHDTNSLPANFGQDQLHPGARRRHLERLSDIFKSTLLDIPFILLLTLGMLALLRAFFSIVHVKGGSMEPTYYDGDRLIARRPRKPGITEGRIVVAYAPSRFPDAPKMQVIKRIAAGPGDSIPAEFDDSDSGLCSGSIVPSGFVALIGDNQHHSVDSRHYGLVPLHDVTGIIVRSLEK